MAVAASIEVVRAFVRLREILSTPKDLARKPDDLENKYAKIAVFYSKPSAS